MLRDFARKGMRWDKDRKRQKNFAYVVAVINLFNCADESNAVPREMRDKEEET